jgi:hypothetical protein
MSKLVIIAFHSIRALWADILLSREKSLSLLALEPHGEEGHFSPLSHLFELDKAH